MPCRPGLRPVEKVDQDTGVCDGMVGRNGEKVPWDRSFARFGSLPSFIHCSVSLASAPSKPRMISFLSDGWATAPEIEEADRQRTARRARNRGRIFNVIVTDFQNRGWRKLRKPGILAKRARTALQPRALR